MQPDVDQKGHSRSARRRPGRPRNEAARQAILAATRGLLLEEGYARLRFEAVAARSGSGKATLYRWWPTKGDLVLEAVGPEIAIGTVPDTGTTREDVRVAVDQLITTFSRRLTGIVIFAAIATAEEDPKLAAAFRNDVVYPWRASAVEAFRRGIVRGDLPEETDIGFMLDVLVGTVFQRTLVVRAPAPEGLGDQIVDLLLPPDPGAGR